MTTSRETGYEIRGNLPPAEAAHATRTLRRWLAFNLVGGLGILVQLSVLAVLANLAGLHYLLATAMAVETAVLHNFAWHERWTWSDRVGQDRKGLWRRLLRFQLANGALSVGGNLAFMWILVDGGSLAFPVANAASIAICSILNFLASDRLVFRRGGLGIRGIGVKIRRCTADTGPVQCTVAHVRFQTSSKGTCTKTSGKSRPAFAQETQSATGREEGMNQRQFR